MHFAAAWQTAPSNRPTHAWRQADIGGGFVRAADCIAESPTAECPAASLGGSDGE